MINYSQERKNLIENIIQKSEKIKLLQIPITREEIVEKKKETLRKALCARHQYNGMSKEDIENFKEEVLSKFDNENSVN